MQKVLAFFSDGKWRAPAQMQPPSEQITQLLQSWSQGDQAAIEKLMPLVYDELHRLAQRYMADERPGHTLQTTALVNEAYLRLVDSAHANWEGRTHFFGVCAQVMRRILVDWARSRQALKRGGDVPLAGSRRSARRGETAGHGPGGHRRCPEGVGGRRPAQGPGGGVAIFRRAEREGNRRGIEGLAGDGAARLEVGKELAAA